jgi:hypothetical protein
MSSAPEEFERTRQVVKHSVRGAACAPERLSVAEVELWLLYDAGKERELLLTYEAFIWRMVGGKGRTVPVMSGK